MNRFFLLVAGLCAATASLAQRNDRQTDLLGKGSLGAGVTISTGYSGYWGLNGRVVPRLHYAVKDGWSAGLEGRYQTNGSQSRYVGAGVSTRYYFVRFRQLAVFGQAGATVGQSRSRTYYADKGVDPLLPSGNHSEQKARVWQGTTGLGAHVRVSNRWALEAMAERTLVNSRGPLKNYGRWQGSAGATYQLKRK